MDCDTRIQMVDGTTLPFYEVLQIPSIIQEAGRTVCGEPDK